MILEGKIAVVTVASSGIGAATVRTLRAAGARVAGGARRVDQIAADLALRLDVREPESCAAFVESVVSRFGGIDTLVNVDEVVIKALAQSSGTGLSETALQLHSG